MILAPRQAVVVVAEGRRRRRRTARALFRQRFPPPAAAAPPTNPSTTPAAPPTDWLPHKKASPAFDRSRPSQAIRSKQRANRRLLLCIRQNPKPRPIRVRDGDGFDPLVCFARCECVTVAVCLRIA